MTVTYDALLDWPDAASIDSEAEGLIKQGESFYDAVAAAKGAWDGLSENYEAPEQQQLLHALDPALRNAESTTAATALVASAMGGFASALQELEPRRKQLISDAEAFNAKECPSDDAGCAAHQEEEQEIQQRINALAEEYRQKITDCTTHLAGINSEGDYSDPNAPDLGGYIQGQGAGLATSLAQSRERVRVRVSRALRLWTNIGDTKVMQWLAKRRWLPSWLGKIKGSIRLPLPPKTTTSFRWNFKGSPPPGNFPERFATNLKEMFLGPSTKPKIGPLKPTVTMDTSHGIFGAGVEKAERTITNVTKTGRALGRGFFVLGTAMTFNSEYQKADAALKEQQPGLSDGERFARAGEKATVRTGSQVFASAVAGAAIGSAIPVGGTAVGFAVGLGVGAAMTFIQAGGKSLGDLAGDAGEGLWNGLKGAGERIFNDIKGFFG